MGKKEEKSQYFISNIELSRAINVSNLHSVKSLKPKFISFYLNLTTFHAAHESVQTLQNGNFNDFN